MSAVTNAAMNCTVVQINVRRLHPLSGPKGERCYGRQLMGPLRRRRTWVCLSLYRTVFQAGGDLGFYPTGFLSFGAFSASVQGFSSNLKGISGTSKGFSTTFETCLAKFAKHLSNLIKEHSTLANNPSNSKARQVHRQTLKPGRKCAEN